jgi:hypothetical protein
MKTALAFIISVLCASTLQAQNEQEFNPKITVKWAPTGLVLGNISLQGEYNFGGKNSLTAKIGLPVKAHHTLQYQDKDADFKMKATSFLAGYRTYFSKKRLSGLYFEPYFKYVHHTAEGTGSGTLNARQVIMSFNNEYNGAGVGAQLGTQFRIGKRVVLDLFFLGPEINSSRNNFKAQETTASLPWTSSEAADAEKNIRDFIDKFPFVRNNTDIVVDRQNRVVFADFKGALPGYRIGFSFGVAL